MSEKNDQQKDDTERDQTVLEVCFGAWREALEANGLERIFLVLLVGLLTIPFAPLWALLAILEKLGVYDGS